MCCAAELSRLQQCIEASKCCLLRQLTRSRRGQDRGCRAKQVVGIRKPQCHHQRPLALKEPFLVIGLSLPEWCCCLQRGLHSRSLSDCALSDSVLLLIVSKNNRRVLATASSRYGVMAAEEGIEDICIGYHRWEEIYGDGFSIVSICLITAYGTVRWFFEVASTVPDSSGIDSRERCQRSLGMPKSPQCQGCSLHVGRWCIRAQARDLRTFVLQQRQRI
mmetsp:Transcript_1747/g.4945  ORF Transcript_1747/g.4945 Transcript_1747/m.4945 type:complete len:219 (-) Transcript_1747:86-742(-)